MKMLINAGKTNDRIDAFYIFKTTISFISILYESLFYKIPFTNFV
jgi:hypothetical protein